ncbi:hypothetical protein XENOCAPTIV_019385 [Xenoophorus captivus]|uniref:Uncharacterized protein n=1 Tax=Xenoophorus captivus TaxID=1517983 RepID=A0ABV0RBD0_9TELE
MVGGITVVGACSWQLLARCLVCDLLLRKLCSQSTDQVNCPTCLTSCERSGSIWNVSCSTSNIILLWTHLFLYPARGCPCRPTQSGKNAGATQVQFCHPVQMLRFCPPPHLCMLCLVSLIQATSWSWAVLISFTPREELVCGQTAHYGEGPAAFQVAN